MGQLYKHVVWKLRGVRVYALVGRSGTGKSFRAKLLAEKHNIDLIIDDGLLIDGDKIIAGRSAKRESTYLGAIKTAVFDDPDHMAEVVQALANTPFKRILLLGTSERMILKMTARLGIPEPFKFFKIEDLATQEEIERATNARKNEGRHVIPVPATEIAPKQSDFIFGSVVVFFQRLFSRKQTTFEKTEVLPEFDGGRGAEQEEERGKVQISQAALHQMVDHCVLEFDSSIRVREVTPESKAQGYALHIKISVPKKVPFSGQLPKLQDYVMQSLERYGGIFVSKVDLEVVGFH